VDGPHLEKLPLTLPGGPLVAELFPQGQGLVFRAKPPLVPPLLHLLEEEVAQAVGVEAVGGQEARLELGELQGLLGGEEGEEEPRVPVGGPALVEDLGGRLRGVVKALLPDDLQDALLPGGQGGVPGQEAQDVPGGAGGGGAWGLPLPPPPWGARPGGSRRGPGRPGPAGAPGASPPPRPRASGCRGRGGL
jgi:hypothetical protein